MQTRTTTWILGGLAGAALVAVLRPRIGRALFRADDEPHQQSLTALTGEALRRGTAGHTEYEEAIPQEDELLQVGDPDVKALGSAYVGDETPGGDMSTPDQDRVDDIGRAYGISEADAGELRPSVEILQERDRRR